MIPLCTGPVTKAANSPLRAPCAVGDLQLPRDGRGGQRDGFDRQGALPLGTGLGLGIIGEQLHLKVELCGPSGQQLRVGDDHQLHRPALGGQAEDQIRADTCWLSRGDDEAWHRTHDGFDSLMMLM